MASPDGLSTQTQPVPPLVLTVDQVAEALGISRRHVYNLIHDGLPFVMLSSSRRIPVKALNEWLDARVETAA
jgi:excisionase family DNA binding protein